MKSLKLLLTITAVFSSPCAAQTTDEAKHSEPQAVTRPIESAITKGDREQWSLQPLVRPPIPEVEHPRQARNPIDNFVLAKLEKKRLSLAPTADDQVLLRRLSFDLLGLPPDEDSCRQAVAGNRQDAYANWVERFLASPRYGERWAQYWLDLARFAETDGFEHDKIRDGAWQYRDWVVRALNADMPYDQFVRFQLAGDLTQGQAPEHEIATYFCLSGPDMPDINEQELRRHDKLNELTSTIGAVLLGYQFQCAQCHDHKYDPISQADFYRLRAIFESALPKLKRDRHVLVLQEQSEPEPALFYHRGELSGAGHAVPAGFPRLAVPDGSSYLCPEGSSRQAFCDWLFSRSNPLTARVIVNRVWQHHFGQGLTENPSDFGVVAGGPTHPLLLDWLACELIDHQWSLKHLHRLIVNSATYRQSGLNPEMQVAIRKVDPENELLSHFPRRRLEGEVIRDAMLFASGTLDASMGGLSVFPPLPEELLGTLLKGQWKQSPLTADHHRRSLYVFARRNLRFPIFEVFDRPDAGATCALRDRSTTAIQSLQMLNSDFTWKCAQNLAGHLRDEFASGNGASSSHVIEALFLRLLGRYPQKEETAWFEEQLGAQADAQQNLTIACVALFNTNEFIYVD